MRTAPHCSAVVWLSKSEGLTEPPSGLVLIVIGSRQRRHIRAMTVSSWLPGSQVGRHRNRPAQVPTVDPQQCLAEHSHQLLMPLPVRFIGG
jgi:hypothetical protein